MGEDVGETYATNVDRIEVDLEKNIWWWRNMKM
jgi:hypothetical protein